MPEPNQILYQLNEVAELMVKAQGITEGHWGLLARFGISGANVQTAEGKLLPSAIVPILELGIQKFEQPSSLTVDASKVNPAPKKRTSKKK